LLVLLIGGNVQAQSIKDSDFDGLSDQSETSLYKTDPYNEDTDKDSFPDLQEILNESNPLDFDSTPTKNLSKKEIRMLEWEDPLAWYISRVSGIVAFILLSLVVAFGLVQTSRALVKIRIMGVLTAQEVHRMIAWSGIFMVILHFGALMFDEYFQINFTEIIIPFVLKRDFTSTQGYDFNLAVAFGIISFYTILLLIITSEMRQKIVSMKAWRTIHYVSFVGYLLFIVHGFMAGSDSEEPWMKALYIGSLVLNISLLLARIFKKKLFLKPAVKKVEIDVSKTKSAKKDQKNKSSKGLSTEKANKAIE
ncbi:ferric reductase-like transmembrane domain-containing protein, partial [Patescibacteria group bacterium]